ncbi:unnamed protein product [Phaedon cochleariae]|uniref:Tyrosyl-DNA phosphodiesterase n=1 Tax=Phaedon cochleariae TaxID=80249 RepID=A0A9N9X5H9_PHACE|nr:unnamed protein product [Phaedon cochleariae]
MENMETIAETLAAMGLEDHEKHDQSSNIGMKQRNCTMLEKLEKAAPYNIFINTIPANPETFKQPNAISFTDLLCPSLGELKSSLQLTFLLEVRWLLEQFRARGQSSLPLTVLYDRGNVPGDVEEEEKSTDDSHEKDEDSDDDLEVPDNVIFRSVPMRDDYGLHHSKIGIYVYKDDSLRVSVSSVNLYNEDWNCYNQGIWLSPLCPKLPDSSVNTDGESRTGFKKDLLHYLHSYKEMALKPYIKYIERADFSAVRVFLVYSIPGSHKSSAPGSHLQKVTDILSKHFVRPRGPWSIIVQTSSLGWMGEQIATEWLRRAFLGCMASHTKSRMPASATVGFSVVYPTVDNVLSGYFGKAGGGCLGYEKDLHENQKWFQKYMYQWKAEELGRTRAMPHTKNYCLISHCENKLAYFLLTSANMSRSAWGTLHRSGDLSVYVRSYEAGIMFLPEFFDEEVFEIKDTAERKNQKLFPFMFDLPLTPYSQDDQPHTKSSE